MNEEGLVAAPLPSRKPIPIEGSESTAEQATPSSLEIVAVSLLLVLAVLGQLWLADSFFLFQRHFWVDELHTFAIVSDPDLGHSMRALAHCVDGNPPVLHLSLRVFTRLTGGPSEITHRVYALLCVLAALLGLYLALRQAFTTLASLTAVLAAWCHPLVFQQAFEGRFYAPWLAAIAWFAYLLHRSLVSRPRWAVNVALACMAILVCTIHYFGIFAWGLIVASEGLFRWRSGTASRWAGAVSASFGPLALLASLPLYFSQSRDLTVSPWIDPPDWDQITKFLGDVLTPPYLVAVLLAAWLAELVRRLIQRGPDPLPTRLDLTALAGLTSLLFFPVVIIAFSCTIQPTIQDRYAVPTVFALASAVGFVTSQLPRIWMVLLCSIFLVVGGAGLHSHNLKKLGEDQKTKDLIDAIREHTGKHPILFEDIEEAFVVCRYAPDLAPRCFLLDIEPDEIGDSSDRRIHDRDLGRRYSEYYGTLGLMRLAEAKRLPKRYLVPDFTTYEKRFEDSKTQEDESKKSYPGYVPEPLEEGLLFELVENKKP